MKNFMIKKNIKHMKKFLLLLISFILSFNVFSQNTERELIIHNNTNIEYLGFYYLPFEPVKDPYISQSGEVYSDYKYKYFIVKTNKKYNKIFTKDYIVKIYIVKDSIYYEIIKLKLDCSRTTINMYDAYYQIIFNRYNGEAREQRFYLNKKY
jgi:hypothetical protein